MRVFLSNHFDGGSSRPVEIEDGATVGDLLGRFGDGEDISRSLFRVNRKQARLTDILRPDDRVSLAARGIAARCSADRLVAAGFAVHRPNRSRGMWEGGGVPKRGGDDPVIRLLRERRDAFPPEIQRQMFDELKRSLDENRAPGRKLFP